MMNGAVDEEQQLVFDIDRLPLGYRFCPKDEDLLYYLTLKVHGRPLPPSNIKEVNLYAHHPQQLAERDCKAQGEEDEWFYFTPRERKYPNGQRPKRAVGGGGDHDHNHEQGYWKATGADKQIMSEGRVLIGYKKSLVFYQGKHPNGVKTHWIMHEFRLARDSPPTTSHDLNHNHNIKTFEDYVVCRVYKKNSTDRGSGKSGREEPNDPMNGASSSKSDIDDDDVVSTADSSPGMENVNVAEEAEEKKQQPINVEVPPSIGYPMFLQNNLQVVPPATGAGGGFLDTQNNNQLIVQPPDNAGGRGRGDGGLASTNSGGYMPRGDRDMRGYSLNAILYSSRIPKQVDTKNPTLDTQFFYPHHR